MTQQEKRNKSLVISLTVLIAATVTLGFFYRSEDTVQLNKDFFTVEDLKSIDEVQLIGRDTVDLKYNGSAWVVNDRYRADRNMIQVLFATLQQAVPKRMISGAIKDSVNTLVKHNGTQVVLYQSGVAQKKFIAGGNEKKTMAYFLDPHEDVSYVMNIPGYRVYVSGIFELDESGFRDKYAFGFNWQNFKSLTAEFPGKPSENFTVSIQKDYFAVEGMPNTDTTKLYNYLDDIARLTVDGYRRTGDSARIAVQIKVTDIANKSYQLKIFSAENQGEMPGTLNNEGIFISTARVRGLMRGKSFFAKKNQ